MKNEDEKKPGKSVALASGAIVGGTAVGISNIDNRPHLRTKFKNLGSTWESASKHVMDGDVLVGSYKSAPEKVKSEYNYVANKIKNAKGFVGKMRAGAKAALRVDYASIASKFADPEYSHAEIITNKNKSLSAYIGGDGPNKIDSSIPTNRKELNIWKQHHQKPNYYVLRPTGKQNYVIPTRRMGSKSKVPYDALGAIGATIKDAVVPKFRSKDVLKSAKTLKADSCLKSGVCSTLPAAMGTMTVGGKNAKNVLPRDYLRSTSYKIVGKIGDNKISSSAKAVFNIPRYTAKAALGAGVAVAGYAATRKVQEILNNKKIKNLTKESQMNLSPLAMNVLKGAGIGLAGAGIGGVMGYRQGADRASTAMANAFAEQNAVENQAIVTGLTNQFNKANEIENARLAQAYYNKGIADARQSMNKQSSLNILNALAGLV